MNRNTFAPALTVWQPWASLMVTPHKDLVGRAMKQYETRGWKTDMRGPILIHAAAKWDKDNRDVAYQNARTKEFVPVAAGLPLELPLAAIIGIVTIEDVITSNSFWSDGFMLSLTPMQEFYYGDWTPNSRFGWKMKDPILFDEPIPCSGKQKIWKMPLADLPEKYHSHFLIKNDLFK